MFTGPLLEEMLGSQYIKLLDEGAHQLEINSIEEQQAYLEPDSALFYTHFHNTIKYSTVSPSNVFTVLATANGKDLLRGHFPSWKIEWAARESGNEACDEYLSISFTEALVSFIFIT